MRGEIKRAGSCGDARTTGSARRSEVETGGYAANASGTRSVSLL